MILWKNKYSWQVKSDRNLDPKTLAIYMLCLSWAFKIQQNETEKKKISVGWSETERCKIYYYIMLVNELPVQNQVR